MHIPHLLFLLVALLPMLAKAGIGGIGNAKVDEGQFTMQLRNAYIEDKDNAAIDGRWRSRLMTDYGLDDNNAIGFYVQGDRRPNDNLELEALIAEHRYEFNEVAKDGFYSGFRLRYTWRDADKKPDDAHIRLILGMPYEKWDFRVNQIIGTEIGPDSKPGIFLETRGQVTREYYNGHRVGIENYSNFGNVKNLDDDDSHAHEVGPVFQGKITDRLSYDAGYRYGLSDAAPDHTFRFFLIHAF